MDKIKRLSIPNKVRIIVISDIHGELDLFTKLLEKVNFCNDDYLIINGDLCEKGSNSKGVLQYVMELSNNHPNVFVNEGNCEALIDELLNENPQIINYLRNRKHTLFNEWLSQLEYSINENTTIQEVKGLLTKNFSNEIQWLTNLTTAIETDKYIFVHAGLEDLQNWEDTNRETAISIPSFLHKSHCSNKYVVVGHWPVANYSLETTNNNPIIDHTKKIIAIDGGNMVREAGQLNALIINQSLDEDTFSYIYTDQFPTYKVVEDFIADPKMSGIITYPHYKIAPLEDGDHFTLCKQVDTKRKLYVKNEYIYQNDLGEFFAKTDVSCSQINLRKGDHISVIDDSCSGYNLIMKERKVGWVAKENNILDESEMI
ncbi:metallophosphoesterase [Heyndrickxia vini]|uniref:Metallophosphoesterase n=1 Tax=Heyndrickxia vini TaxID=1476025 RepID=A0ABX7DWD1_9BACI|nr:metallophosphoesterase [Heyndrickxia vini]QQZ07808.1 metallophosphoesterase [Heyndrickxia vini]